jgi:hypothetical protein
MVTGVHGVDCGTAVRRVNESLQGPVVEILAQFVPDLRRLPPGKAYERTLDDIGLLQRCFTAFRAQRAAFQSILVDAQQRPVTDDRGELSCGRTLEQVVAMIVRTAAKRYFRRKWNPAGKHGLHTAALHRDVPRHGLIHRVSALLGAQQPARPQPSATPTRSRADELYDALKQHLLHEWQVPLVPTYAEMSPPLARALGDKLLSLRKPEDLRRIIDDPAEAAKLFDITPEEAAKAGAEPVAASAGRRDERTRLADVLTPDSQRLRPEAFGPALLRPDVRAQLSNAPTGVRLTETLKGVGGLSAKLLVAELGLRVEQLAVILLVAHETIGADLFGRIFGQPGEVELIMRLTQKARLAGLNPRTPLNECAAFVRQLFASPPPRR